VLLIMYYLHRKAGRRSERDITGVARRLPKFCCGVSKRRKSGRGTKNAPPVGRGPLPNPLTKSKANQQNHQNTPNRRPCLAPLPPPSPPPARSSFAAPAPALPRERAEAGFGSSTSARTTLRRRATSACCGPRPPFPRRRRRRRRRRPASWKKSRSSSAGRRESSSAQRRCGARSTPGAKCTPLQGCAFSCHVPTVLFRAQAPASSGSARRVCYLKVEGAMKQLFQALPCPSDVPIACEPQPEAPRCGSHPQRPRPPTSGPAHNDPIPTAAPTHSDPIV
jgi:hypothetical protein